MPLMVPSFFSS